MEDYIAVRANRRPGAACCSRRPSLGFPCTTSAPAEQCTPRTETSKKRALQPYYFGLNQLLEMK